MRHLPRLIITSFSLPYRPRSPHYLLIMSKTPNTNIIVKCKTMLFVWCDGEASLTLATLSSLLALFVGIQGTWRVLIAPFRGRCKIQMMSSWIGFNRTPYRNNDYGMLCNASVPGGGKVNLLVSRCLNIHIYSAAPWFLFDYRYIYIFSFTSSLMFPLVVSWSGWPILNLEARVSLHVVIATCNFACATL